MSTTLIIVIIVAGVAALILLLWTVIRSALIKKQNAVLAELSSIVEDSGEEIRLPPQGGTYRGALMNYPVVKNSGVICLTDQRIIFKTLTGTTIEVPAEQISNATEDKWFKGAYRGGQLHLIVHTKDENQIGFFVADIDAWKKALLERAVG